MNNQIRYHGLDALRALAMILGVVLHASMFYLEVEEVGMVEIRSSTHGECQCFSY
jgi:uncharacterized membrane protein